jgi:hypothetical protein
MVAQARIRKTGRELGALSRLEVQLASVVRGVRQVVRGGIRQLERQATDVQATVRRRAAKTLQDAAIQLRRAEKAIAPPPSRVRKRRRGKPQKQAATAPVVRAAKPSAGELAA